MTKRIAAVLLLVIMAAAAFAGGTAEQTAEEPEQVLRLSAWIHTRGWYNGDPTENVVQEAVAERTGVIIEETIISGELSNFERFNLLFQAGDLPDLLLRNMWGEEFTQIMPTLEAADMVHKFTDAELDETIPLIREAVPGATWVLRKRPDGLNAYIPQRLGGASSFWLERYPEWGRFANRVRNNANLMLFRDDILTEFFPEANTFAEQVELLAQNGELTWDDIHVPGLETYEQFIEFLYAVQERYGDEVIPYGTVGSNQLTDRWMNAFLGSTLYVQFDPLTLEAHSAPITHEDEFRALFADMNRLYNDGIFEPDLAILQRDQFVERLTTGQYAVAAGPGTNLNNVNRSLQEQGAPFGYVAVLVSNDTGNLVTPDGYGQVNTVRNDDAWVITKSIERDDALRVLEYFDYHLTDEALLLFNWGPEETGLWEEVNGERRWVDDLFRDVVAGIEPLNALEQNYEYYGIMGGNPRKTPDAWYTPFRGRRWPMPYWPTVTTPSTNMNSEVFTAAQDIINGYYDDAFSTWTSSTATYQPFWSQWRPMNDELTKAVVASNDAEFDSFIETFYDIFYNEAGAEAYFEQQATGYHQWLADNPGAVTFHPDADLSILENYR